MHYFCVRVYNNEPLYSKYASMRPMPLKRVPPPPREPFIRHLTDLANILLITDCCPQILLITDFWAEILWLLISEVPH